MASGFIAETDAQGSVVWVWRRGEGERIARPVWDTSAVWHELRSAEFSGAAPEAISAWFARQARRSGSTV